jgi:hypothetical protein
VRREETSAYDVSKATATVSNKAASRLHLDLICSRATSLCELAGNRRTMEPKCLEAVLIPSTDMSAVACGCGG